MRTGSVFVDVYYVVTNNSARLWSARVVKVETIEFSKDEASKKELEGHWQDDAILLLRPESLGFGFLIQVRAFDLAGITKFKKSMKRKYEKDSGRSSKVTPSCKCVVFVDKSALKKLFSRV